MKQNRIKKKDSDMNIIGYFHTPSQELIIRQKKKEKLSKVIEDLNTINHLDLVDIHRKPNNGRIHSCKKTHGTLPR